MIPDNDFCMVFELSPVHIIIPWAPIRAAQPWSNVRRTPKILVAAALWVKAVCQICT